MAKRRRRHRPHPGDRERGSRLRCGNIGRLEAVAGGGALAARLNAEGIEARNARDVVDLVRGDDLGGANEKLLAGVRERTFLRSLPLATGALRIVPSELGDLAGLIGAAVLVIEHVLVPDVIDRAIEVGTAGARVR